MPDSLLSRPKALITGDQGFVGQHALAALPGSLGLSALAPEIDIRNQDMLVDCLQQVQPEYVIHLAAQSSVPAALRNPLASFDVNFLGTYHLLEALRRTQFKGRFLFVGTGDVYGPVAEHELPLGEDRPLRPTNPYAVSKIAAEALCYQWSRTGAFEIVMARPFNHVGPGQATAFAVSDFARQIAEIRLGHKPPVLTTGNIDVSRDFTDVRDVVRAYALLLGAGKNGEVYNVCSGVERSIRKIVETLADIAGVHIQIEHDPQRYRPAEQARVAGNNEKLHAATGWRAQIDFEETLKSIYLYWEKQIGQ